MSTDDVLARLIAGLDRDEATARAAATRAAEWRAIDGAVAGAPFTEANPEWGITEMGEHTIVYPEGWPLPAEAEHIARYNPARVLRQVAAIRKVIEAEMKNLQEFDGEWGDNCSRDEIRAGRCTGVANLANSAVLTALAGIYTDPTDIEGEN